MNYAVNKKKKKKTNVRLDALIQEEEQYQSTAYQNDPELTMSLQVPASPRYIAVFRLTNSQHQVDDKLYGTVCTICQENFKIWRILCSMALRS